MIGNNSDFGYIASFGTFSFLGNLAKFIHIPSELRYRVKDGKPESVDMTVRDQRIFPPVTIGRATIFEVPYTLHGPGGEEYHNPVPVHLDRVNTQRSAPGNFRKFVIPDTPQSRLGISREHGILDLDAATGELTYTNAGTKATVLWTLSHGVKGATTGDIHTTMHLPFDEDPTEKRFLLLGGNNHVVEAYLQNQSSTLRLDQAFPNPSYYVAINRYLTPRFGAATLEERT